MSTKMWRAAVIGCGGISMSGHLPGWRNIENAELVAVCDIDEKRAKAAGVKFAAPSFTNVERMMREVRPDVVDVCVSEVQHYETTMQAIEGGAHVICEKAMTDSLDKARTMVAKAKEKGLVLAMQFNYRHMPMFKKIKEYLEEGTLGELATIAFYAHSGAFHHAIDLLSFFGGEIESVSSAYRPSAQDQGSPPESLGGWCYVPSRNKVLTVHFASGALGVIYGSHHRNLWIEDILTVDVVAENMRLCGTGISLMDTVGELRTFAANRAVPLGMLPVSFFKSFEWCNRAFLASLDTGKPPTASGMDGLKALMVEEAEVRSNRERRWISLSEIA